MRDIAYSFIHACVHECIDRNDYEITFFLNTQYSLRINRISNGVYFRQHMAHRNQSCIKYSTNKYQYQWSKYQYQYQYVTFKYQYKYCA